MVLVRQIADDSPNLPNFLPTKFSCCMVIKILKQKQWQLVSLDQSTAYNCNQGSLSTGHYNLKNDQSNVFNESDLLWKQLKRVIIPIFLGDKRMYQKWKAVFMACIANNTPAASEYKLLQLQQCLTGEALKAIESLECL